MPDRFVVNGGKKLRCGYTTGSCAAAAAKAAALMLTTGAAVDHVSISTPKGVCLRLEVEDAHIHSDSASCAVRKDGGDDIDATDGALIYVKVSLNSSGEILVDGGEGVGRVTRAGLDQPVGAAAINCVPRQMIVQSVREVLAGAFGQDTRRGADVTVSVPRGKEIARKTYNPRLGIESGISILGTTGIVEPMSEAALLDTIRTELDMLRAASDAPVLVTPGNYGEEFAKKMLGLNLSRSVLCSNFLGDTLDYAAYLGFQGVLLVGHIGKLVKLAGGIFQTHSRVADARMEILAAHAALAGAPQELVRELMGAPTTDRALELLKQQGLAEPVVRTLLQKMEEHLKHRAGQMQTGVILFSSQSGMLGQTSEAPELLQHFKKSEEPE